MKLHSLAVSFLGLFGHTALGQALSTLKAKADADFDKTVNRAVMSRAQARHRVEQVAGAEVERLETLVQAANRRALSLREAGVVSPRHSQRLADVFYRTV